MIPIVPHSSTRPLSVSAVNPKSLALHFASIETQCRFVQQVLCVISAITRITLTVTLKVNHFGRQMMVINADAGGSNTSRRLTHH
jgi:hypothetical protein